MNHPKSAESKTDWSEVRACYESTGETLRQVAARFGVAERTVFRRSSKEGWTAGNGENGSGNGSKARKSGSKSGSSTVGSGSKAKKSGSAGGENGSKGGSSTIGSGSTAGGNGSRSGSGNGTAPSIPADIGTLDKLAAARFYHGTLRWAVHPLNGPDKGNENERGKKPLLKGWRKHAAFEVTPEDIRRWFGPGTNNNLGCVVRPPFVHVDLDSKPDGGESVRKWLESMPELADVPRERTGGGAHLVFRCEDLPETVAFLKQAPSARINEAVMAELYINGTNIVLSPSVHKSGHTYRWEVTGVIPQVAWADIRRWFGFTEPEEKRKPGRPPKEKPWWAKYPQDLRTLDLPGLMRELGMLGECLDPDEGKWSVRCPWEDGHSGDKRGAGTDTVIFSKPETMPGFRCLHAHCGERGIRELVGWAEEQRPGIIAAHCADLRVWEPGGRDPEGRPRIVLPGTGRAQGVFGLEIGRAAAPQLDLFLFGNSIVEIGVVPVATAEGAIPGHMLNPVTPTGLITAIERSVETGVIVTDEAGDKVFLPRSMSDHDSRVVAASRFFTSCLPRITRMLDVPVPLFGRDGGLIYPERGYDERFGTWLNQRAPELRTMGLDEALDLLAGELFATPDKGGFWWHDEQARTHALARLVTPFCRGLMGWRRPPLWIYDGNREGCGKDTCADVTHVLYTGRSIICAPLSKDCDEEMRKRITSALLAGARFFHLANMKGHVRYSALEAATDNSGVWEDRRLGQSENLILPNETEFSFSANNATWEPDIERRCRRIRLHFSAEDVNARKFRHADLRGWIRRNRSELLSAVAALVSNWIRQGRPHGPNPFASFPEWAHVVGGTIHAAGLGDCCLPHADTNSSGDQNTQAMRRFFVAAFEEFGGEWVEKEPFLAWVEKGIGQEIFEWIDFGSKRGLMSLGRLLAKYDRREFNGVALNIRRTSKNWCRYRFFKPGHDLIPTSPSNPPENGKSAPAGTRSVGLQGLQGLFTPTRSERNILEEEKEKGIIYDSYGAVGEKSQKSPKSHCPEIVTSRGTFPVIASAVMEAGTVALDIETYGERKGDGLDPWKGDIRLLTLKVPGSPPWIIDLRATGGDLGELAPAISGARVIVHNARFDLLWLRVKHGLVVGRVFCTLTAARVLANGTKPGNNLDQCLERYLGVPPAPDHSLSDWGSMLLTDDQLAYAARDVEHLHDLMAAQEKEIKAAGLGLVMALENDLVPAVVGMEAAGIAVDREKLVSIRDSSRKAATEAANNLRAALSMPGLNPGSPVQMLAALRSAGLDLDSTNEEALKAADDGRLVPLLLSMREAEKRAQQAEGLIDAIKADGRIHSRFDPTGTATGRFSSREPNLQNIGRGGLREAFVAPPGRKLVVADYSQIELRGAAVIAGETKMIEAYKSGADLHRLTASVVLGKPESEVTKADRQLAKAVNFGLIYGQYAPGLVRYAAASYGVTMAQDQAESIRETFFRTYTRLRQWHGKSHQTAERGITEVRTKLGRRRLVPATASEWERFTALVNTPVQGGTADGMKMAIAKAARALPDDAVIVSTVHDELIVECAEESADRCLALVRETMASQMSTLFPEVPVEVEANICTTWGEK